MLFPGIVLYSENCTFFHRIILYFQKQQQMPFLRILLKYFQQRRQFETFKKVLVHIFGKKLQTKDTIRSK